MSVRTVRAMPGWYAEPPEVGPGTLIGSYRLFSDPVTAG